MKEHYSVIKYKGYTIEGCGSHYELYHPYGFIGSFADCKSAKAYVDKEKQEADNRWNEAVLRDFDFYNYIFDEN